MAMVIPFCQLFDVIQDARQLGTPNLTNEILFSRIEAFHRISSYPAARIESKGGREDMYTPTL